MNGEAKGSTPNNPTIGEDGESEADDAEDMEASDPESSEFDWKRFGSDKPAPSDYRQQQESRLKEIIKAEIKSVLSEVVWQQNNAAMTETAPPDFPADLEQKIKRQYGSDSPKAFATMWKIHNKGWVDEIQSRLAEAGVKKKW
jgi:hypothetical protein